MANNGDRLKVLIPPALPAHEHAAELCADGSTAPAAHVAALLRQTAGVCACHLYTARDPTPPALGPGRRSIGRPRIAPPTMPIR